MARCRNCCGAATRKTGARKSYVLKLRDLVETFDRTWLPIPLFRRELSGDSAGR